MTDTPEITRIRAALAAYQAATTLAETLYAVGEFEDAACNSAAMTAVLAHIDAQQAEIERLRADADNAADTAVIALRKAWQLGQTYWQQADSEYTSHHAKADVTQQKFKTLCDETSAAMKGATP